MQPIPEVRDRALALLSKHDLRAADALQLSAAVTVASRQGAMDFVCLDERLCDAARSEGFRTLPPAKVRAKGATISMAHPSKTSEGRDCARPSLRPGLRVKQFSYLFTFFLTPNRRQESEIKLVELSDATWQRLQEHAVPPEDRPEDVINRTIDRLEN